MGDGGDLDSTEDWSRARGAQRDWFRRHRSTLAVVVVGSVLVAALYDVRVRQQHARAVAATKTAKAAAAESAEPTSSTSTTIGLEGRLYNVGDCVVWDLSSNGGDRRATHVVPCDQTHIIEIAGPLQAKGFDHYPTDAEWKGFLEPNCRPLVEQALLHGPIDPIGRFGANAIYPLPDSWGQGDRTVWCGVEAKLLHERSGDNDKELFTGKIEGAHQAFDYPVGTCLALTHEGAVACSGPHAYEVIGKVDLTSRTDPPPPSDQAAAWNKLLNAPCQAAFRSYFHSRVAADVQITWQPLPATTWQAGDKVVDCMAARFVDQNAVTVTGPLASAP